MNINILGRLVAAKLLPLAVYQSAQKKDWESLNKHFNKIKFVWCLDQGDPTDQEAAEEDAAAVALLYIADGGEDMAKRTAIIAHQRHARAQHRKAIARAHYDFTHQDQSDKWGTPEWPERRFDPEVWKELAAAERKAYDLRDAAELAAKEAEEGAQAADSKIDQFCDNQLSNGL